MAKDPPLTISAFLKSQVWRSDYLLIEEHTPERTRFPHEQKLEILHALCTRHGYQAAAECEKIRRKLYTQEYDETCPPHLLLALAYLPDNVVSRPDSIKRQNETLIMAGFHTARSNSPGRSDYRLSSIHWNHHQYWLYLPEDIHSLLIERDCALLAA